MKIPRKILVWEKRLRMAKNQGMAKKNRPELQDGLVRKRRFELPRQLRRYHLKVVRLPISPPPQLYLSNPATFQGIRSLYF